MDEQLIIEIWDTFKDYVSEKNKEAVASQFVDFLMTKDVELNELEGVLGYDSYLDLAIQTVLDEHRDEEEEEESDDWDYDEDEE